MFDASVLANIVYGLDPNQFTQQAVEEAAIAAGAHSFIASLPQGYDTMVGASGSLLSGGQKQRIAIARAVIRRCPSTSTPRVGMSRRQCCSSAPG